MSRLLPVSYREFVRRLRKLGFSGPFPGGKHLFMERGGREFRIPNPHKGDISVPLLPRVLKQLEISSAEWESAG